MRDFSILVLCIGHTPQRTAGRKRRDGPWIRRPGPENEKDPAPISPLTSRHGPSIGEFLCGRPEAPWSIYIQKHTYPSTHIQPTQLLTCTYVYNTHLQYFLHTYAGALWSSGNWESMTLHGETLSVTSPLFTEVEQIIDNSGLLTLTLSSISL